MKTFQWLASWLALSVATDCPCQNMQMTNCECMHFKRLIVDTPDAVHNLKHTVHIYFVRAITLMHL